MVEQRLFKCTRSIGDTYMRGRRLTQPRTSQQIRNEQHPVRSHLARPLRPLGEGARVFCIYLALHLKR